MALDIRTSPLVEMAGEAKRPTRWWLAWIVTAILIVGFGAIGGAIGSAVLGDPGKADTLYQYMELFTFGVTLLGLFLWLRFKEGRRFSSVGFRGGRPAVSLLLGFLIGAAMMAVGVAIPFVLGQLENGGSEHTNIGAAALLPVLGLIVVFAVQASTEEALTRGFMLQTTGRQAGPWLAILGTSIFFAVIHLDFSPIPLLNITLYAVFASFVALGAGNLWLICGIHAGWNFFQGNVFGIPVSGNAEASSLLGIGPSEGSNDLLTGGAFGIEASLSGTLVLVIALVVAVGYFRRQQAARAVAATAGAGA